MNAETFDEMKPYEPKVRLGDDPGGFSMNSAKKGEQVKVLTKAFFTSYEDNHHHFFDQILYRLLKLERQELNRVIVVIRNKQYHIYYNFPMMMEARSKGDIVAGSVVFKKEILDIRAVRFKDAIFDLDIRDGDKFVWLFRIGWGFGLYSDFTGKMKTAELWPELGRCYREIMFHSLYSFLSAQENFDRLLDIGWFPFAQILGDEFESLKFGIDEPQDLKAIENRIAESFTKERIMSFTKYWWKNDIFREKKDLITAGISAYLSGEDDGAINCITNLTSQIEGIVRLDYHRKMGKAPTTDEWKEYLRVRASESFSDPWSLGFPGPFLGYIEKGFFKRFDIEKGDVKLSRHSVAHGVANRAGFTRVHALQLILTMDQIHYFLQNHQVSEGDSQGSVLE